uniref:Uncharacterized protein n=1 Tax=Talaromyces marneffei PM1 TaxID=1077442 RepID=A0A093UWU9_TALMA
MFARPSMYTHIIAQEPWLSHRYSACVDVALVTNFTRDARLCAHLGGEAGRVVGHPPCEYRLLVDHGAFLFLTLDQ